MGKKAQRREERVKAAKERARLAAEERLRNPPRPIKISPRLQAVMAVAALAGCLMVAGGCTALQRQRAGEVALDCTLAAIPAALEGTVRELLQPADWQTRVARWLPTAGQLGGCALQRVAERQHQASPAAPPALLATAPACDPAEDRACVQQRARWALQQRHQAQGGGR